MPEAHLEAVIIELAGELVVVLGDSLASGRSTLAEHARQILLLQVNLLLAPCRTHVAFKGLVVNDFLDGLTLLVDAVVCGGEITLLEVVLSLAMPREQMVGETTLLEVHRLVVVLELLLSLTEIEKTSLDFI